MQWRSQILRIWSESVVLERLQSNATSLPPRYPLLSGRESKLPTGTTRLTFLLRATRSSLLDCNRFDAWVAIPRKECVSLATYMIALLLHQAPRPLPASTSLLESP